MMSICLFIDVDDETTNDETSTSTTNARWDCSYSRPP